MLLRYRQTIVSCTTVLLALLAPIASTSLDTPAPRNGINAMEEQVGQQINNIRREQGLVPLQGNAALAGIAREYSRRMAVENFFAHEDPAGRTLLDRLRKANVPYQVAAENIFTSTNMPDPVAAAVSGWMNSPGHRANILRPEVTQTGVGIWREGNSFYFTQIFILPPG